MSAASMYYGQVRCDPTDPDRLHVLQTQISTSTDGGQTWQPAYDPAQGAHVLGPALEVRHRVGDHQVDLLEEVVAALLGEPRDPAVAESAKMLERQHHGAHGIVRHRIDVEMLGGGRHRVLRVSIDKPQGVTHADCELVSQQVGAILDVEDGDVERAAAEVVHRDRFVLLLVEAVGQRRRRGLVDDALHVEPGDAKVPALVAFELRGDDQVPARAEEHEAQEAEWNDSERADDEHGTGIEVYPERTVLSPGRSDATASGDAGNVLN